MEVAGRKAEVSFGVKDEDYGSDRRLFLVEGLFLWVGAVLGYTGDNEV